MLIFNLEKHKLTLQQNLQKWNQNA